jgi:hypothetical protein
MVTNAAKRKNVNKVMILFIYLHILKGSGVTVIEPKIYERLNEGRRLMSEG